MLVTQRQSILDSATRLRQGELEHDQDDSPDDTDMALAEASLSFAGRIRERETELLSKIDEALEQIDRGAYGECTSCGDDIGIKRLLARPVATLCVGCKEEQERFDRQQS
jgi:DnaK suppressor protein